QKLAYEKEVLGFYVSDHPLNGFEKIFKNRVTCSIADLGRHEPKKKVTVGGIVGNIKEFITKKGTRMAFACLEDQTGLVELVVFSESFAKYGEIMKSDRPLIVQGVLEREDQVNKILVDSFMTIESLSSTARELILKLNEATSPNIEKLAAVL